jgi:hypothetical protein
MAIGAVCSDWIVLVGFREVYAANFMARGTQFIRHHFQQAFLVRHVGVVTGPATILYWLVDGCSRKAFRSMAVETEYSFRSIQQFRVVRVVHDMTGFAIAATYRLVH